MIFVRAWTIIMTNTSYTELHNPLKGRPSAAPPPSKPVPANFMVFKVTKEDFETFAVYYCAPGKDPLKGIGRILEIHPEYTYLGCKVMSLFNDPGRLCFEFNKSMLALQELKKHFTIDKPNAEQQEFSL